MANAPISRRNFMQRSALWAAAFAGAGHATITDAQAAREKELNILCWEGYNSAQVLDPFRSSRGATVKAESLTNDPTMINRLRAGETNIWDLINVNNPWARKIMLPEKLIKPLDRAKFEPFFNAMMPTTGTCSASAALPALTPSRPTATRRLPSSRKPHRACSRGPSLWAILPP